MPDILLMKVAPHCPGAQEKEEVHSPLKVEFVIDYINLTIYFAPATFREMSMRL